MGKIYGERWEIRESHGRGGQAEVFLVHDLSKRESSLCVLKSIPNPKRGVRFVKELTACKRLSHPSVSTIIDHSALESDGSDPDKMYLVMPLMESGDLERRVALYKGSLDSTLQVASALADALSHAHAQGIIHRDVKPANVLFAKEDHSPVLSDFGICLLRDELRVTETAEVVGPRAFMAPELEDGGRLEATPAADAYSLGKIIYFMLSGGVIVPRERHAEPQYDIFTEKGGRYLLLARLLDRLICGREKRIQKMAEVGDELRRIGEWEHKQGAPLSARASAFLSTMLSEQRSALSVAEHNSRVSQEEQARLEKYKAAVADWFAERVKELAQALTHNGISSARALTAKEAEESSEKCSQIKLGGSHGGSRFAQLMLSRGLEFVLKAAHSIRGKNRLLLNVYSAREVRITLGGQSAKRELADQAI